MAMAMLSTPATSLLAGGRSRRSAPARRATVIRAAVGSYADELVSTAVSDPVPHLPSFSPSYTTGIPPRDLASGVLHVSYVVIRCYYGLLLVSGDL
jgi:fructose-bisphosphate aldolase, class I